MAAHAVRQRSGQPRGQLAVDIALVEVRRQTNARPGIIVLVHVGSIRVVVATINGAEPVWAEHTLGLGLVGRGAGRRDYRLAGSHRSQLRRHLCIAGKGKPRDNLLRSQRQVVPAPPAKRCYSVRCLGGV